MPNFLGEIPSLFELTANKITDWTFEAIENCSTMLPYFTEDIQNEVFDTFHKLLAQRSVKGFNLPIKIAGINQYFLDLVVGFNNRPLVEMLLKLGCDPSSTNGIGLKPLDYHYGPNYIPLKRSFEEYNLSGKTLETKRLNETVVTTLAQTKPQEQDEIIESLVNSPSTPLLALTVQSMNLDYKDLAAKMIKHCKDLPLVKIYFEILSERMQDICKKVAEENSINHRVSIEEICILDKTQTQKLKCLKTLIILYGEHLNTFKIERYYLKSIKLIFEKNLRLKDFDKLETEFSSRLSSLVDPNVSIDELMKHGEDLYYQ